MIGTNKNGKKESKLLLFIVFALLMLPLKAFGYVITGQVVDDTNTPIKKAVIIGRNSANKVRIGVETDPSGHFSSVNVNDSTLTVEITKEGYSPIYMIVDGTSDEFVDLGKVTLSKLTTTLDEVVVTAQSVIQKADKYIIFPTTKEVSQSTDGLSLLNNIQYKMPGVTVNESLQTVKADNNTPVFKINGKPSDLSHFLSINPNSVLRVEYHNTPDIRYGNRQTINIILKPREDGGFVLGNLMSGFYTGFINGNIGANYRSKKSEFDLNYRTNWRDYSERNISSDERFIAPSNIVDRKSVGMPSAFNYLSNELSIGYTYFYDASTVFSFNSGIAFESQNYDDNSKNTEITGDITRKFNRLLNRSTDYTSPNVDLFYKKQIDDRQHVEVNAFGRYSTGDFNRYNSDVAEGSELPINWTTFTRNNSWRCGLEVMYSKAFSNRFTMNVGVQELYNSAKNSQTNDASLSVDKIGQNRFTLYTQAYGRINKFQYGVNVGCLNNRSNNNNYIVNASRIKMNFNLGYGVSKYVTLNYLFIYDPALPSTSQQSVLTQTIDAISVRQGNPDLKPSEYFRNRIYARYAIKKFNTSLWVSHSRTNNAIYYDYSYITDKTSQYYGKFMSKATNGRHEDLLNLEWYFTFSNLFNHLTLWGKVGFDYASIDMSSAHYNKHNFYGSVNGNFEYGNWLISANYQIKPRYNLNGNIFTSEDRWNTIKVAYRHKNWHFSLTGVNLFTKRGSTFKQIEYSEIHPMTKTQCIKDNANMILFGISYRLDYGKKQDKTKRSLNNDGIERGIDVNY